MGNFQDQNTVNNLVGPAVGIVGEGQLTAVLKRAPDAVVGVSRLLGASLTRCAVLDEFDKAHPDAIPKVFLSAFDSHGVLRDSKTAEDISTVKATFILTSNVGAADILNVSLGESRSVDDSRVKLALQSARDATQRDVRSLTVLHVLTCGRGQTTASGYPNSEAASLTG